jgi:hypothetical protein
MLGWLFGFVGTPSPDPLDDHPPDGAPKKDLPDGAPKKDPPDGAAQKEPPDSAKDTPAFELTPDMLGQHRLRSVECPKAPPARNLPDGMSLASSLTRAQLCCTTITLQALDRRRLRKVNVKPRQTVYAPRDPVIRQIQAGEYRLRKVETALF